MNNEKRTQYMIITIVVLLLLVVIALITLFIINAHRTNNLNVKLKQIYSSDYQLSVMGDYFIGTYKDGAINVVINNQGEEIYNGLEDIFYDNIYSLKDDNYLIYSNRDNVLKTYIFDGSNINELYTISDVSNIKPIIYKNSYQEYIVGFVTVRDNKTYLYNTYDSNVVVINDAIIVEDNISNDNYYVNSNKYLIIKDDKGLMGVIDYSGNIIIPCKYKNILNTYNDSFIVQNEKELYGIISNKGEELIKINYKVIGLYNNYFLVVDKNNKMAIYSNNYEKVTDFKMNYDSLLDFDLRSSMNSIRLYRAGGRLFVINNYMEDINKTEYEKHNLYVISNGRITETIEQLDFGVNDLIYIYDKDYNIKVYDSDYNLMFEVKLDDVKNINKVEYVANNIVRINYVNINDEEVNMYYDTDGGETTFDEGKLVLRNEEYVVYVKKENDQNEINIMDNNGNLLDSVLGNRIITRGNYAIVDNSIYEIVRKEN